MGIVSKLKKLTQSGFTMLEATLSAGVLGIGLMGSMAVTQNSLIYTAQSDRATIARAYAQEKMEQILADKEFKGFAYVKTPANYPFENLGSGYTRTVTLSEVSPTDLTTPLVDSGIERVQISVQWGTANGANSVITTLVTDN